MSQEVFDWFEQAEADFKTAKGLLSSSNYYASVNFSQQSAEKGLKAIYIFKHEKTPPKIHDLVELGRLIQAPDTIIAQAGKLTVTYFFSRYPGAAPEIPVKYYTKEKAEHHLHEAEVILQWAKKMIKL